jgi:hypothetical protein
VRVTRITKTRNAAQLLQGGMFVCAATWLSAKRKDELHVDFRK